MPFRNTYQRSPAPVGFLIAVLSLPCAAQAETFEVSTAQELIDAINAEVGIEIPAPFPDTVIEVEGTIIFDSPYQGTLNALPVIDDRYFLIRGDGDAALVAGAPGFRLVEIMNGGALKLVGIEIRGFESPGDGGVFNVANGSYLMVNHSVFESNQSAGHGGAIFARNESSVFVEHSRFTGNQAGKHGGAIYSRFSRTGFSFRSTATLYSGNQANAGCAIALDRVSYSALTGNVFLGPCDNALLRVASNGVGPLLESNTLVAKNGVALTLVPPDEPGTRMTLMSGNLLASSDGTSKSLCNILDSDLALFGIDSLGFNIATDQSCGLDEASDSVVDGAGVLLDLSATPVPTPKGSALDVIAPQTLPAYSLGCPLVDATGLGRPQDGNLDGVFGRDLGGIEKQGGPDIGAPQSGAYFDPAHPGEGYFVEMLGDGRAWVTFFTYQPIFHNLPPSGPAWFFAVGEVNGNSIVIHEFKVGDGLFFGVPYESPADFQAFNIASLSLVFSNCESRENPGRAFFDEISSQVDAPEFSDQLSKARRLTSIVGCGGEPVSTKSGLSGSFYSPERVGEGIVVQWLSEDRVLAVWYGFDVNGRAIWMISGNSTVDGNTVTLDMSYPAKTTGFGPDFDPEEIELAPWGTMTLEYTGCDTVTFSYDSVVERFGSGSYLYTRLTRPAGTTCNL